MARASQPEVPGPLPWVLVGPGQLSVYQERCEDGVPMAPSSWEPPNPEPEVLGLTLTVARVGPC